MKLNVDFLIVFKFSFPKGKNQSPFHKFPFFFVAVGIFPNKVQHQCMVCTQNSSQPKLFKFAKYLFHTEPKSIFEKALKN